MKLIEEVTEYEHGTQTIYKKGNKVVRYTFELKFDKQQN